MSGSQTTQTKHWLDSAQQAVKRANQATAPIRQFKDDVTKYRDLYNLGKNLLDPDTRRAAAFKKSLDYLMERAGRLLGKNLTKHPYFVLNKVGLEAVFEAVQTADTIDNARASLKKAERQLDALSDGTSRFVRKYSKQRKQLSSTIAGRFRRSRRGNWIYYLRQLNSLKYQGMSAAEALDEDIQTVVPWLIPLAKSVAPQVKQALLATPRVVESYAALSSSAGQIVLAEKTYEEKIEKFSKSSRTVSHGVGKMEERQRQFEEVREVLKDRKRGDRSLQQRVRPIMEPATRCTRLWIEFVEACTSDELYRIGSTSGTRLPWEMNKPRP